MLLADVALEPIEFDVDLFVAVVFLEVVDVFEVFLAADVNVPMMLV
jgi:hypothetical protein